MEVRNKDNVFLFSDTTRLMHIIEKGEVTAASYLGELYGFELEDGVESISYSTRNATLYISPVTKWNGKRYQYVTSDSEEPIKYFKWSRNYFPPMDHGAGLELRDAKGNIVFNNQGYLGSFKGSFYSTVSVTQDLLHIKDAPTGTWMGYDWYSGQEKVKTYCTTDGFPALYMAACAKMWGVYCVYHREEGKGGFLNLFHDSWEVTDGYIFAPLGKLPPGPSYQPIIKAEPNNICRYGIEDCFVGGAFEDGTKSMVNVSNKWSTVISPLDSIMAPQTIWLPAMTTLEAFKDVCYSFGYVFESKENGINVKLADRVARLHFKTLKGEGDLENLNRVVYVDSSTEVGEIVDKESGDIGSSTAEYINYTDKSGRPIGHINTMKSYQTLLLYDDTGEMVPWHIELMGSDDEGTIRSEGDIEIVSQDKASYFYTTTVNGRSASSRIVQFKDKQGRYTDGFFYKDTMQLLPYSTEITDKSIIFTIDTEAIIEHSETIGYTVKTHYALTEGISCDFSIAHIVSTI